MYRITIEQKDKAKFYQDMVAKHGSPLLLLDCDQLTKQFNQLSAALPNVVFYYAIKSLPHPAVIRTLDALGCPGAGVRIADGDDVGQGLRPCEARLAIGLDGADQLLDLRVGEEVGAVGA